MVFIVFGAEEDAAVSALHNLVRNFWQVSQQAVMALFLSSARLVSMDNETSALVISSQFLIFYQVS